MELSNVLDALKAAGAAAGIGNLALKIREWLQDKAAARKLDQHLKAALDRLPYDATGDDVVNVLKSFYAAEGGPVTLKAGSDGGGETNLINSRVEGGSGPGGVVPSQSPQAMGARTEKVGTSTSPVASSRVVTLRKSFSSVRRIPPQPCASLANLRHRTGATPNPYEAPACQGTNEVRAGDEVFRN
jgi:hypothetical protein